ncbi:hypothetical protein B7H23_12880 [Notoacmeibacter marinus]|uniref:Tyr recombinase domain-containing protein n=1 Tax=Notoacmeibacter marinus TaxID=1876515 RepID=A0A231UT82_9HYPH|nr:site-specific integrase [Notoacmeibacter marinus]OXS99093.1 hypothetical protein B7H23_12880 [Notoacmeibacter marinus]
MAKKSLTARFVESVSVEKRTDFWDETIRGLVLRVSPAGAKSWTVVYTNGNGEKRRLTLGQFPAIGLEKARQIALKALAAVAEGADPAGDKKARREAVTLSELADLYVESYAKRHKKTWAEDERILRVDVLPAIGQIKAKELRKRDVLDVVNAKIDAGKGQTSRSVFAVVRKMLNWAADEDHIDTSPIAGLRPRVKQTRRERVLTHSEIQALWAALPSAKISPVTADVIRLLILTGQRSGEVCGMNRAEIDLQNGLWAIPAIRTKNGLAHTVPLSTAALEIVSRRLELTKEQASDCPLFARIGKPIESNAIAQATRKSLQIFEEQWRPHDLRRTAATGMADVGVLPHVVEAVLNHVSGFRAGVAGVYNRAAYDREKRTALELWAEHVIRPPGERRIVSLHSVQN